jgi:hypothetical protein
VRVTNRPRRQDCRPGTTPAAAHEAGPARRAPAWAGRIRVGRRGVQVALGLLWLIDGALQLQPFMFSPRFSAQVLLPAGSGQPGWVSAVVGVSARQVAAHPAAWNAAFAAVQLALGAGLLLPRLVRPALLASGLWAAGVWWLGEGFGGLWSGHASLITGAPGAVILYAVLAAAAWPPPGRGEGREPGQPLAAWFPLAWLVIWLGGAWLQLLPGQNRPADLSAEISASAGAPGWLAHAVTMAASAASHGGAPLFTVLVTLMAAVGIAGSWPGPLRAVSAALGAGLALLFWLAGESVGELYSGHATDPNTGPLLIVMALALLGSARRRAAPGRLAPPPGPGALAAAGAFPVRYLRRARTAAPASGRGMNWRPAAAGAAGPSPHAAQPQPARPREHGQAGGIG